MAISVDSALTGYNAYQYGSNVRVKIDRDNDGYWNKDEVEKFAKSYEKATGNKIDVEKLFEKYDVKNTGKIDLKTQDKIYKDDALNLKSLAGSLKETGSADKYSSSVTTSLDSLLAKMSTSGKMSLTKMVYQSEQNSTMWSLFNTSSSELNNYIYGLASYQNYTAYNKNSNNGDSWGNYLGQMMNITI